MMEYTDRHFRHLVRLISNRTLLYTEMVAANAVAHERKHHLTKYYLETTTATTQQYAAAAAAADNDNNDNVVVVDYETARLRYDDTYLQRFLAQGQVAPVEGPSVLQLGGSDPETLCEASMAVWELTQRGSSSRGGGGDTNHRICDYTALNLNCGCPSPKVAGKGCFGAALMEEPHLVADLARAMHDGCNGALPVTVKCRIGTDLNHQQAFSKQGYAQVDPQQEYGELCRFIETVAADGIVTDFQIHARIAVLQKSFSPADNRKIPPLKYDVIRRLVEDYSELTFSLNGGIETISGVQTELQAAPGLRGVMIGRAWAADPWSFAMADELLYGEAPATKNRWDILQEYGKHADAEERRGDPVRIRRFILKAIMPLFTGEPNAKRYRIALDEIAGMPKKLQSQGKSLEGHPPLSEMILDTATKHLSEETLFRSPQGSYERVLWEESKRRLSDNDSCRSQSVTEWQTLRSEQAARTA